MCPISILTKLDSCHIIAGETSLIHDFVCFVLIVIIFFYFVNHASVKSCQLGLILKFDEECIQYTIQKLTVM